MRLWTLHPRCLDPAGFASVRRKALLPRQALRGRTKGCRNHPQPERFRSHPSPLSAINACLQPVYGEALMRGHGFDKRKLGTARDETAIRATDGQLACERKHLQGKLARRRSPGARRAGKPGAHPLFRIVPGPGEARERRT